LLPIGWFFYVQAFIRFRWPNLWASQQVLSWGLAALLEWFCVSETEGQELCVTSGIAINQSSQADLMSNASSGETFGNDADHNSEHGGTTVEALNGSQLL